MKKRVLVIIIGALCIAAVSTGLLIWRQHQQPAAIQQESSRARLIPEEAAPDFSLADGEGNTVTLSSLRGNYVILFFSGGLSCLSCLPQIQELNSEPLLNSNETVAFSVIPDSASSWRKAQETSASFARARPLLDTEGSMFQAYASFGFSDLMDQGLHMAHTYFVINKEGMVLSVIDDPSMAVRNDMLIALVAKIKEIESATP